MSIQETEFSFILLAAFLLAASVWVRAQRWQWLINDKIKPSVSGLFEIEMIGYFANNIFPLRAGEFLRAYFLKKKYNINASFGLGTIAMERLSDTFGLIILGIFLLVLFPLPEVLQKWVFTSGVIFLLLLLIIYFSLKFSDRLKNKSGWKGILHGFIKGFSGLRTDNFFKIFFFTGIIWSMYWLDTYIVQHALNLRMSGMETLLILIMTSLAMSIPSAPGMVGTFHAAVKFTMVQVLDYDPDLANSFSIILHGYGFICLTVIGAFYYIKSEINPPKE